MRPYRRYTTHIPHLTAGGQDQSEISGDDRKYLVDLYECETRPAAAGEAPARPLPSDELRNVLFGSYGVDILLGTRHAAPCATWRAERGQHRTETDPPHPREDLPRFANRVHVFEQSVRGDFGRYLGFVHLRPDRVALQATGTEGPHYTTTAFMVPPRFMTRPRYHLIDCHCGGAEGVTLFRGVPWTVPAPDLKPFGCLLSAVHQAIMLKSATFELPALDSGDMIRLLIDQLEGLPDAQARRLALRTEGPHLEEVAQALREKRLGGGILEQIRTQPFLDEHQPDGRDPAQAAEASATREVHRCLTDYLANGLPVILLTSTTRTAAYITDDDGGRREVQRNPHVVTLIGLHLALDPEDLPHTMARPDCVEACRVEAAELPGRFLLHDVCKPLKERSAADLLRQAWARDEAAGAADGRSPVDCPAVELTYLALGPKAARLGIWGVREATRDQLAIPDDGFWRGYLDTMAAGEWARTAASRAFSRDNDLRIVTRLLDEAQLSRRYQLGPGGPGDYSLGRIVHDELVASLARDNRSDELREQDDVYYWATETGLAYGGCAPRDEDPAQAPEASSPALLCVWWVGDEPDPTPQPLVLLQHERKSTYHLVRRSRDDHERVGLNPIRS